MTETRRPSIEDDLKVYFVACSEMDGGRVVVASSLAAAEDAFLLWAAEECARELSRDEEAPGLDDIRHWIDQITLVSDKPPIESTSLSEKGATR